MAKKKIAILADSGTDIPSGFTREHAIFIAPLKIIYKDREYEDASISPHRKYTTTWQRRCRAPRCPTRTTQADF